MLVDPDTILPSQDYLKPGTVKFILACISNGESEKLPPTPVVRADSTGRLVAIDGHNLIAVMSKLGKKIDVHIAKSKTDKLPDKNGANTSRNIDLSDRYDSVLSDQGKVSANGINSFSDLIAKYPDLFD